MIITLAGNAVFVWETSNDLEDATIGLTVYMGDFSGAKVIADLLLTEQLDVAAYILNEGYFCCF